MPQVTVLAGLAAVAELLPSHGNSLPLKQLAHVVMVQGHHAGARHSGSAADWCCVRAVRAHQALLPLQVPEHTAVQTRVG